MEKIPDMLVYQHHIKCEGKWGYKWIGFCNGKRFVVLANPNGKLSVNSNKGEYVFVAKADENLLPPEIQKLISSAPLSNEYFIADRKYLDITIEIVMMLIENGYDINSISMRKYSQHIDGNVYICRYFERETKKIIIELLDEETIAWRGGCI